jgi:hypothetical protein
MNDFIKTFHLEKTFISSFNSLLDKNTAEDLDIPDKNISIDTQNLTLVSQAADTISFKSLIYWGSNEIGYYQLVFTLNGQIIDEYFVIYS